MGRLGHGWAYCLYLGACWNSDQFAEESVPTRVGKLSLRVLGGA